MAKILLADDSTHAQRMGAKILTAEGHEVSTVSNGQAAIQALEKSAPDLVVADIFMPGRNGYEVCHFIKTDEKLKGIPVLLIIGAMEPYDPEEGRRAGADGLITKPLESSNLLATVKDLLNATKRFAPARAAVPKETLSGKIILETAGGEVELPEEAPQWDETPEEVISTAPQGDKLHIPQDMGQQAVGMLTDYMTAPEGAAPASPILETALEATMNATGAESKEAPVEAPELPAAEITAPTSLLDSHPQLDIAEMTVWTAEATPMTAEEEKLFERPSADWGDLAQLVEQSAAAAAADAAVPPPLPWQIAETAVMEQSPEPAAPTAMQYADGIASDALLETAAPEMLPTTDALLVTMDSTVAETATESDLESYENLAETVMAQGPMKTRAPEPPAPPPTPAMPPPVASPVPDEEAAAAPPWEGPVEELEAAPADRNVQPSAPSGAEAAPSLASVDPATLEHIVRGVVGELMPQIIAQVKQALKS